MSTSPKIVVFDEIAQSATSLEKALLGRELNVDVASSPTELIRRLSMDVTNLIIMSLHGLDDRYRNLTKLIPNGEDVPFIVLSDDRRPIARVRALEAGAVDFILRPFHLRELIIRMTRHFSHGHNHRLSYEDHSKAHDVIIPLGPLFFNMDKKELTDSRGNPIDLTETEAELLLYFLSHPQQAVSRDVLWRALRGRQHWPLDRTLDGHVSGLRTKLGSNGLNGERLIKSVRGIGYLLVVPDVPQARQIKATSELKHEAQQFERRL